MLAIQMDILVVLEITLILMVEKAEMDLETAREGRAGMPAETEWAEKVERDLEMVKVVTEGEAQGVEKAAMEEMGVAQQGRLPEVGVPEEPEAKPGVEVTGVMGSMAGEAEMREVQCDGLPPQLQTVLEKEVRAELASLVSAATVAGPDKEMLERVVMV